MDTSKGERARSTVCGPWNMRHARACRRTPAKALLLRSLWPPLGHMGRGQPSLLVSALMHLCACACQRPHACMLQNKTHCARASPSAYPAGGQRGWPTPPPTLFPLPRFTHAIPAAATATTKRRRAVHRWRPSQRRHGHGSAARPTAAAAAARPRAGSGRSRRTRHASGRLRRSWWLWIPLCSVCCPSC